MPVAYSIDPERSIAHIVTDGATDPRELLVAVEELLHDPRLENVLGVVGDWSRVEGVATMQVAFECVRILARIRERLTPLRLAIVVRRDANYGMANASTVYANTLPGVELRPFRSVPDATTWLLDAGTESSGTRGPVG